MINDVLLNKSATIQRCIRRVHQEYENNPANLDNYTKQDSIILNIQRACEAAIDISMHVIADKKLGLPQNSRQAFLILEENGIIDQSLAESLCAMVGFRNIAVHDYQALNLGVVQSIIEHNLNDISHFSKIIASRTT